MEDRGRGLADGRLVVIHLLGCCLDVEHNEEEGWTGTRRDS